MISNYAKLKILLSGDPSRDPFWADIFEYRRKLGIPHLGLKDEAAYKKWRDTEPNGFWSKEAAVELFRPRPGIVIELNGKPQPTEIWIRKYDFRHFNQIAFDLADKYILDSTGSVYKKLTNVLLYNNTSLKPEDVEQPVDIYSTGDFAKGTFAFYFIFNKHTRREAFIKYTITHGPLISFFQKYLPIQKQPPFEVSLNLQRQAVEVRIFRNTKSTNIKKSWDQIADLQTELDEYSPRTRGPDERVLLAVAEVMGTLFTQRYGGGLRRLSTEEKLAEVKRISGGIEISEAKYKEYRKQINRIKKGRLKTPLSV